MSSTGNFIVVFKDGVTSAQIQNYVDELGSAGGEVKHRYDGVLNGFAAAIPESYLTKLQSLVGDGIIDYIEPDGVVTTQ